MNVKWKLGFYQTDEERGHSTPQLISDSQHALLDLMTQFFK